MQNHTAQTKIEELLSRAVRTKEVIVKAKTKHRALVQEIKEKRNQLMIDMTEQIDGSVMQSQIEREIDLLDQREFKLHSDFKKILSAADGQASEIQNEIVHVKFGPNRSSDTSL